MGSRTTIVALLAALLACARSQPSPEYEQARELWTKVVQERGEDAGDDPRAARVVEVNADETAAPMAKRANVPEAQTRLSPFFALANALLGESEGISGLAALRAARPPHGGEAGGPLAPASECAEGAAAGAKRRSPQTPHQKRRNTSQTVAAKLAAGSGASGSGQGATAGGAL